MNKRPLSSSGLSSSGLSSLRLSSWMQLASAVALALTLCSCAGPSAPEAGPGATATAGLSTHAGTWQAVSYSFDYPADWTVTDTSEETGAGVVSVASPDGTVTAELVILIAWGAECPCVERPAVHLGDVDGAAPLSGSGPFTVRSVAMDLTDFPQERAENGWPDNVQRQAMAAFLYRYNGLFGPPAP